MPRDTQLFDRPLCDSTADISDVWAEETDPNADCGELCTAFFDHAEGSAYNERHEDITCTVPCLIGISVQDEYDTTIYPRDRAISFLGYEAVCRVEDAHMGDIQ